MLDPAQKLFSSVSHQDTGCLSDELLYPRGGYLANRQMAKKGKLVGVLFVTWEAHSQLKSPEANGFGNRSPSFWICSQNSTGTQLTGEGPTRADLASPSPQPSDEEAFSEPQC